MATVASFVRKEFAPHRQKCLINIATKCSKQTELGAVVHRWGGTFEVGFSHDTSDTKELRTHRSLRFMEMVQKIYSDALRSLNTNTSAVVFISVINQPKHSLLQLSVSLSICSFEDSTPWLDVSSFVSTKTTDDILMRPKTAALPSTQHTITFIIIHKLF